MKHVQRLKKKVFKRTASPAAPAGHALHDTLSNTTIAASSDVGSTEVKEPRSEKWGLFKLAEGQPDPTSSSNYPVDIIAVHGLNGDAYSTWIHSPDGTLWLRDLLPKFLPGCRVYTYGYPSKVFSQSSSRVQDFARDLLIYLRKIQEDQASKKRPIIFICHSLGGIVFKQALVIANEDNSTYGEVLRSIIGVAFLGTPHRGSNAANLGSILGTIVNTFMATASFGMQSKPVNADLVSHIVYDSVALEDLSISARNRLGSLSVVSCFEDRPTPPFNFVLVNRASATLNIPNEEQIPMFEDHKTICRFPGETESYKKLAWALRRIASHSPNHTQKANAPSIHSSTLTLGDLDRTCMTLLNDHDVAKETELLLKPVAGTCQWIRSHNLFRSWFEAKSNVLLWLTGHPGSGKTMLSYSLTQYLDEIHVRSRNVLVYLCQSMNKRTDARAVLIGLILRIIDRHRSLVRQVRAIYERQGSSMVDSFALLWRIFLRIMSDPKAGSVFVVLDALDECEASSCRQLIESMSDLLTDSSQLSQTGNRVKFLITSRPFLHQSYAKAKPVLQSQISIDDDQAGYANDLRTFIREKVDEISLNREYSSDIRDFLYQTITSKADRTFLWIHIVLASIEKSLLSSRKELQRILNSIPDDLVEVYQRYLSLIPVHHQEDASHLLKLLLASSRPLQLEELKIAFAINDSHVSMEELMQNTESAIAHTVQGILGPMVRITGRQVSLVHQSAREYLLEQVTTDETTCSFIHDVNESNSALVLATACIQYLLLDDFSIDLFPTKDSTADSGLEAPQLDEELPFGDFGGDLWGDEEDDEEATPAALFRDLDAFYPIACDSIASKYGFYDYASLHWAGHFSRCEDIAPGYLRAAARSLLDTNTASCRNWLQFFRTRAVIAVDDDLLQQQPLTLASRFNFNGVLSHLLGSNEFSIRTLNRGLYLASRFGHADVVTSLLKAGAEPNSRESLGQTPLTTASDHGHLLSIINILSDERADINATAQTGRTALSYACGSGHNDIVNELISRSSCKPDDPDKSGATPFFWAVGGGNISTISTLARARSININHQDKKGRTALSWAAGDGMVDTLSKLLKLRGIDVNLKDKKGRTPLSWAAGNGCDETVELLLNHRVVDKDSVDDDKRNAISWASGGGHGDVLVKLLNKGCRGVDTQDIDGWTPLTWAIQKDVPETIRALIENDQVQMERRDRTGRTALAWAVEYGTGRVVSVLLEAGADPHSVSNAGTTPISIAERYGRDEIHKELIKYGTQDLGGS